MHTYVCWIFILLDDEAAALRCDSSLSTIVCAFSASTRNEFFTSLTFLLHWRVFSGAGPRARVQVGWSSPSPPVSYTAAKRLTIFITISKQGRICSDFDLFALSSVNALRSYFGLFLAITWLHTFKISFHVFWKTSTSRNWVELGIDPVISASQASAMSMSPLVYSSKG